MKTLNIFIFILIPFNHLSAQKSPISIPITSDEYIITNLESRKPLKLELAHSDIVYYESEKIEVYGPGQSVDVIALNCFRNDCNQPAIEGEINYSPEILGQVTQFRIPLGLELIGPPKKGIYYVSVIRDNKVHHKRSFRIVEPEPMIFSATITSFDGSILKDTLKIDKVRSLDRVKIKFNGYHLDTLFEYVTIQDLPIKKHPTESRTFILDDTWTRQAVSGLKLGVTEVVFKRMFSDKLTKFKLVLSADDPVIEEPSLTFEAGINENKINMLLNVQQVFHGAELVLENNTSYPDFLIHTGRVKPNSVNALSNTITMEVLFDSDRLVDNATFKAKVINKDNNDSNFKNITVLRKEENIEALAYDENKPLVSGMNNRVMLKRLGGNQFNLESGKEFKLAINGFEPVPILARKESDQSFSAEFKLPDGLPPNIKFTLVKGESTWSGSIENILLKPRITIGGYQVYRGGSLKVNIQNAKDVRILVTPPNDLITWTETANGSNKLFEIAVANEVRVSQFTMHVMLKEHLIMPYSIPISNWPEPKKENLLLSINRKPLVEKKGITVLSDTMDIDIGYKLDSIRNLQHFSARMIKEDGTPLGKAKPLILNDKEGMLETKLSPDQVELQKGEPFNIEITNPLGDAILKPCYIERSRRDQWIFTAGISVLDVPFDNDEESESKAQVFQGINLAAYYMIENVRNPNNRYLGIGPNALFSEQGGEIKLRGAVSLLFFEKLVVGVSFGENDLGLLIGANIRLADFSSLLSSE